MTADATWARLGRRLLLATRIAAFAIFGATVAYFLAIRARWYRPDPQLLARAVLVLCVWMTWELGWVVALRVRGRVTTALFAGRAALALGALLVFGGGLANWAYSLQGFVVMGEGESAPFFHGIHLQEFAGGPLSDVKEMDLVLHLDEIELEPAPGGGFSPASTLRLERPGERMHRFRLTPRASVSDGTLRFHHGVFGYAPRVVIRQGDESLFDQSVPFTTRLDDGDNIVFKGEFTVARHGLHVWGEIRIESLDPEFRGHPQLALSIVRDGEALGAGVLGMGQFAKISGGHEVGFGGLTKWAEIDINRRHYPEPMYAGAGLFVAGLALLAARLTARAWRKRQ